WGFGPVERKNTIPTDEEVEATKASVGYKKLAVRLDPPALKKVDPGLRVDLSAIAKGHGADRVGEVIRSNGIPNFFVEIGGEIFARGKRADGQPWQVGIEAPLDFKRSIQMMVGLSGAAIATSGDYRNFFESEGKRFSHTIDPNTGRPVTHQLASASAVADNCALADGIATCMVVLGKEQGLKLAESKHWAVLLMERNSDQISSSCSTRFSELFPQVCKQLSVAN
ncbi:MAG TPA: FAD:protein FMN transferase, partial [Pirellula sp.]|nr:FAD:protein FMN transferase [Pirellula sp.]